MARKTLFSRIAGRVVTAWGFLQQHLALLLMVALYVVSFGVFWFWFDAMPDFSAAVLVLVGLGGLVPEIQNTMTKGLRVALFLVIAAVGIGGVISSHVQDKQQEMAKDKERKAMDARLDASLAEERRANAEQREARKEHTDALNKVSGLQDKISGLQKEQFEEITGGDSFPHVILITADDAARVMVHNHGKHPLPSLDITMTDPGAPPMSPMGMVNGKTFKTGAIGADRSVFFQGLSIPYSSDTKQDFYVSIESPYALWSQSVLLRRQHDPSGKSWWSNSTQVSRVRMDPGPHITLLKIVYQCKDKDFPTGIPEDFKGGRINCDPDSGFMLMRSAQ